MNDLGKKERLRNGEAVELKPGVFGRVNKENRTLELDSGKVLPIGKEDQRDLFPGNEQSLNVSRRKEKLEGQIKKAPFGEFLHQFGQSGILSAPKDWLDYATKTGDQYLAQKQAEGEVSGRISEESPITSGLATAASFAPDIALTHGMSALKAAPLLTAASAGSRIVREPEEVATESLFAAGAGKLLDIGGNALNKIANRRAANRALPGQQLAVREANELQNQQFNMMKENVKNVNEARLQNHQNELSTRQNRMIQEQNQYQVDKSARDAEVIRLKNKAEMDKAQRSADKFKSDNEYKIAKEAADKEDRIATEKFKVEKKQYEEDLKKLPEFQKQAQAEYSANVVKNAEEIERSFPKNSKIATEDLGVSEFLENNVNKSGIAGTSHSNQANRFLNSLFPEGEIVGGRELSKRYKSLEDAIQRSSPEVQTVLRDFKQHLGTKLPSILEDSVAYHKVFPLLKRTIESDIRSIMNEIPFVGKGMDKFKDNLVKQAISGANSNIKNGITPVNFAKKLQSGELGRDIANNVLTVEDFLADINLTGAQLKNLQKQGMLDVLMKEAERKHAFFVSELSNQLQNKLARYEVKALQSAQTASKKLGKDVKNTFGMAEPVGSPNTPTPPSPVLQPQPPVEIPSNAPFNLPTPIQSPLTPPIPVKPTITGMPQAPTPLAEPTLSPAQGLAERTGDLFEKDLFGGNTLANNPLTKLAGLKYLLGKGALPAEAAYVGLNALTSPGAAGQAARMTFKQGGIQAIESWAQKYPSYHDGILENPQDRRSLTKEIEDSYDIPIEQKAVIQSKVNRGKPLQERL